ncbi:hypothetical protein SAMN04487981_101629 [Streptomyces sp. cf386]|uniref:hypothetical protein n=1 Tax=Streptomyces sp. cf386 TaxID=1761904 RepID=UPI00088601CE|nr:hypothetical protein [Streptomyces sp. cf386]SDM47131.1 hypothetical protein SAMN04487981_101629 [Streptomyces sp. cf386]
MNRLIAELGRARQELSTWLYKGVKGSRVHERVAQLIDDHQTAVKDAHAHQLAEQIRADAQARHDRDFSDNRIFRLKGAQAAADLIDPEVSP